MKTETPSKTTRTAPHPPPPLLIYATFRSCRTAQLYKTKNTEGHLELPFEAVGGFPEFHSTSIVLHYVFQGPSRHNGSCGPGTAGEVGRHRGKFGGDSSGNADCEVDVAESSTSPSRGGRRTWGPFRHPEKRHGSAHLLLTRTITTTGCRLWRPSRSQGRSRQGGFLIGCQLW